MDPALSDGLYGFRKLKNPAEAGLMYFLVPTNWTMQWHKAILARVRCHRKYPAHPG
jgi:hypothetical protein